MIYYRMNPRYKKTSSGQTMTVILDLNNSDPTTWATYADDAVGGSYSARLMYMHVAE